MMSPESTSRYALYVLGTLFSVYMLHHLDRITVSLLLEPIGREFKLSDGQRGLLAGFAYAVPFAVAGVPLGLLIDRVNRVRLLAILLATWSGLTALCAFATGFGWLVLVRIGIGIAESGGTPANVSLLCDYFPPASRAQALGIYYMAPHIVTILAFALVGIVATDYGWRAAFLLVGIPGLLLVAVLAKAVREPPRIGDAFTPGKSQVSGFGKVFPTLWLNRAALHMMAGGVLSSTVAAGLFTWIAPFMIRLHGVTVKQAGIAIALGLAPWGALGSFMGRWCTERLGGYRAPRAAVMLALSIAITVPFIWLGLTTASFALLIACLSFQMLGYVLTVAPSYAAVVGLMPEDMRGVSTALMQVLANVVGFGVGAQIVGLVSDHLRAYVGTESLRYTLIGFVCLNFWAVLHFLLAARALARDARSRRAI